MTNGLQIAFLTGRSDPRRCALTPQQAAFLQQLAAPARTLVPRNFPYAADTLPWRPVPLWRASWNNLREHLASRRSTFVARYRPALAAMLRQAPHTVVLAGSCGLSLWLSLATPELAARASVIAFGAVTRRRPSGELLLLQGQRDWLSRWFGGRIAPRVPAGHLDYLACPSVLAHCRAFIVEIERSRR